MKREDILAMSAGRDLDALVAEKVMGWYKIRRMVSGNRTDLSGFPPGIYGVVNVAKYSTDISAAWEVVGKFKCYELSGIIFHTCKLWKTISQVSFEYQGKTAPEAICKAALLAVLEEDKPNESHGHTQGVSQDSQE